MPHPQISGNPALQNVLKQRYIGHRWRTPFVTDQRMSKEEAHARAWAYMMAVKRQQAAQMQRR